MNNNNNNNNIDTNNTRYRKSRYTGLKNNIHNEYANSIDEIDTSNLPYENTNWNYIDLFAGGGGLSLGIKQAGFNKLCDVEILPFAHNTLVRNFPEAQHYNGDITEFNPNEYLNNQRVHLVVGGPPCQGFSVAGKRDINDQRNFLFNQYVRVVREVQPYFFVLENVPGIITLKKGEFYHNIIREFEALGYNVSVRIMEAADYGVPQLRTRAIFIGNRLGLNNPYPIPILTPENYNTIDGAIADLENAPRCAETNHEWTRPSAQMVERISQVPPGGSLYETFSDSYKRQRIGHPSMTIKENHGGTHIHYRLNRCISAREMARLQTFPDSFIFEGRFKQAFIQVGNAVPPLLAKHIGLAIREQLQNNLELLDD